jgi:hyperosmotically inducible protein
MKRKFSTTFLLVGTLLAPVFVYADDVDASKGHTSAYVKDSVITTKIKAKLAAEHASSLTKLNVDTDASGIVWLTGTTATQADADKAVSIARETKGVTAVKSEIVVKPNS